MKEAWDFCEAEAYWSEYLPLTPWGKDKREARTVYVDANELKKLYDDIEDAAALLAALAGESVSSERVAYHLKRMPRLPLEEKLEYEFLELFQVKKFLANYRGLARLIPGRHSAYFGFLDAGRELSLELDRGGSDAETFFIADSYHPELKEARAALASLDSRLAKSREAAEALAKDAYGYAFDGRDFLVVPKERVPGLAGLPAGFSLEPYDDHSYIIRLLPSPEALSLGMEREACLARERDLEQAVVQRLSSLCKDAMPELRLAVAAVTRLDIARAGAVLAAETGATRPGLDSDCLRLANARLYPCEMLCRSLGLVYVPLSARFGARSVVLFGSNMGGKTVALKTVLFLQLIAQAGLFVPADRFESRVFANIEYVGELAGERLAGLSGFGFEVRRLQEAWAKRADSLVAFDELARTTGSHEAEALLSAVVAAYGAGAGSTAFFATHFRGITRTEGAEFWRMRGLDHEAASECLDADAPLPERLAGINRHMRYELEPDAGDVSEKSDALAIASMLGLDPALVARAKRHYGPKSTRGDNDVSVC